ncbi:hypothetical protein HPB52_001438 [Rhipicephalus sanguineus]|uniref:Uncharacterized protein n=1 Tax=Rhipicephalus sanguineus TaxID=34632 RepID=A0A9D4QGJ7_RHISA|nr:hypothetical protein HPB52_001438 [Rhipicephalus sanguineus]
MRGGPCSRVVENELRSCPRSMLRLYEAPCGRQAGLETTGRDDLTAMGREKLAFLSPAAGVTWALLGWERRSGRQSSANGLSEMMDKPASFVCRQPAEPVRVEQEARPVEADEAAEIQGETSESGDDMSVTTATLKRARDETEEMDKTFSLFTNPVHSF